MKSEFVLHGSAIRPSAREDAVRGDMSRREFSKRLVMVIGGALLAVIGVPLLVLPGSGMVLILLGAGLVGEGFGLDVRGIITRMLARAKREMGAVGGKVPPMSGAGGHPQKRDASPKAGDGGISDGDDMS